MILRKGRIEALSLWEGERGGGEEGRGGEREGRGGERRKRRRETRGGERGEEEEEEEREEGRREGSRGLHCLPSSLDYSSTDSGGYWRHWYCCRYHLL